ncbi:hypothetical protein [Pimelobacter sp. 30-1]|uniref:hypothetical protein n=1 Tax=Pimelobacter sp. 30-1 TaxID=2004991 RepID=UPI001C055F9B|nr:hypothetical protein [Pimelobacter sp. 30-1]MBU2698168.1 hypothetical protein [Pimelobacter sp. 30-1]
MPGRCWCAVGAPEWPRDDGVAATGRTFWLDVTAEVAADPLLLAELPGFVAAHLDPDLAPDLDPDGLLRRAEARFRASGDPAELLDLTLDAEHSDQVLCLKFGPERTVREVAWES